MRADQGLILCENGKLYDSKKGQTLPDGMKPMTLLCDDALKGYPEPTAAEVVPRHVARYHDMMALADRGSLQVIGSTGMLPDKPGFKGAFTNRTSASEDMYRQDRPSVQMPTRGHWRVIWMAAPPSLPPGDTVSIPENLNHRAVPSMTGEASLFHVVATDDPASATWTGQDPRKNI